MFDPNVVLKTPVNSDDEEEDDVEPPMDIERNFGEFMALVESQQNAQAAVGVEGSAQTNCPQPGLNVIPRPQRQMLRINPHNSCV